MTVPDFAGGACRGEDPEWWWPTRESVDWRTAMQAVRVCHSCPIELPCLRYALDSGETDGIWGGMTPSQREAARKEIAA